MILVWTIIISLIQWGISIFTVKSGFKIGRKIIFLLTIIGHLFVFPRFFIPSTPEDFPSCGMPALAITFYFWFIGNSMAIITYYLSDLSNSKP